MESKDKNQIELLPVAAVKCIFWLILIAWAVICSVTAVKYQEELRLNDDRCEEFHEGWVVSDTVVPVTIPGKLEGNGTVVRIQNTIPQDIDDRTTIIVKGLHQSMRVWIDGNLVSSLDNAQTRPFGRYTSSGYIRIPLQAEDAGKIIEIEYSAPDAETAGQLNDIRIGSDMGILFWIDEFNPAAINLFQLETYPGKKCNSSEGTAVRYHDSDNWPAHPPVGMWFNYGVLNDFMKEWLLRKEELKSGKITRDEYFEWKINWPQTCDGCGKYEPKRQWRSANAELSET